MIDPSIIFPIGIIIGIIVGIFLKVGKEMYTMVFAGISIILIMQFTDKIMRYIPFGFEDILMYLITFIGAFMMGMFVVFFLKCVTSGSDF